MLKQRLMKRTLLCNFVMNAASFTLRSSPPLHFPPLQISSFLRRNRRKNSNKPIKKYTSSDDQRLNLVIDVENITNRAKTSFKRFLNTSKYKYNRFISSGNEALEDFKTLVTVDYDRRVIISCRRSSLEFLGETLIWGFVIVIVFRALVKLGYWVFGLGGGGYGSRVFVSRRDRSLAGREVVVEKRRFKEREGKKKGFNFKVPINPLSPSRDMVKLGSEAALRRPQKRALEGEKLPKWWPDFLPAASVVSGNDNQELQKEANRVIRAIMDNRMCGKDITEEDIIQFRRICKSSGARVCIETANARDSFYRSSVDFVLNYCSSSASSSTFAQIDGEDARQFVAGLADSIGLQNVRAATIVSAAVAARTRSCFLQAWAFEMQGKRTEARMELLKICIIHQIFPPQESSPEMEMVAQGLKTHLRVEQRELLLNLLTGICGPASRSAAEALGLINRPSVEDDMWHLTS